MERVAFLVEETGERIDCLLNPETVEVTRLAGVRARGTANGRLTTSGLADDPLTFTGGGRTELTLDLLFDVDFVDGQLRPADVRVLTRRLWLLAENSADERGARRPPLVRLVWGKAWNVPGVIVAVAERFDMFTAGGAPHRSWLRMKLVRMADDATEAWTGFDNVPASPTAAGIGPDPGATSSGAVVALGDGNPHPGYSGVRFDLLANDALGSPLRWRALAEYNRIANPLDVAPGTALGIPPGVAGGMPS
jgi:hypothetical protein